MKISLKEAVKLKEAAEERIRTGETSLFLVSTEHTNDIPAKSMGDLLAIASVTKGNMVVHMAIVYGGTINEHYTLAYDGDASVIRDWMFNKLDYKPTFDIEREAFPEWGMYELKCFGPDMELKELLNKFIEIINGRNVKAFLPYFLGKTFNEANHVE